MARATSSLPVPLSPVISTGKVWSATRPMALYASCIPGQQPMMASPGSSSSGGATKVEPWSAAVRDINALPPTGGYGTMRQQAQRVEQIGQGIQRQLAALPY